MPQNPFKYKQSNDNKSNQNNNNISGHKRDSLPSIDSEKVNNQDNDPDAEAPPKKKQKLSTKSN